MPVMTFARNEALRQRMFLAYNTRAYPQNRQVLLDLMKTRQEIADILGFETWADLATANQMMESAAKMQKLIDELEQVSRPGAEAEYKMVLAFAQSRQPGLTVLDAASRGYWLEQYRRSAFDFDSQSVRPYFPYKRVQKGILETAERLFQVTFEPSDAAVWDPAVTAWDVFDGERSDGPFLPRHAPPRRQGQVVQRGAHDSGHGRDADSGGRADLQFSRRQAGRSRPDAVQRRGHLLPRIRAPDARHPGWPAEVGRPERHRHRRRFRRSPVADAGGVLPRCAPAGQLCAALPDQSAPAGGDWWNA